MSFLGEIWCNYIFCSFNFHMMAICILFFPLIHLFFFSLIHLNLGFFFFFFLVGRGLSFVFLGPHLWHMEVPRLRKGWNWSCSCWPACTTATAVRDLSLFCDIQYSSWQRLILNPLSKTRDGTCVVMDTSSVLWPLSHHGNSPS